MLSKEDNERLVRVGPGTAMGAVLRRYWHPIGAAAELDENPIKAVRILGEDLVLYRDQSGTYGLVDRRCAHRRADLSNGFVEKCGLRCSYHGWLYDEKGQCREAPFDDLVRPEARFRNKTKLKAYPIQIQAGLIWAYLGPEPAPCLPDWRDYYERGFQQITLIAIPCNWLQCQENSIDPVHFEWLHQNWPRSKAGSELPRAPRHVKVGFDEFEFGFIYRRVLEDIPENELWTVGRACVLPNLLYVGGRFGWSVPIDDENTLRVSWRSYPLPGERPFQQERIPYWYPRTKDPATGAWLTSRLENQDVIAMVGQGVIAERMEERLGESDRGVIMLRKRLLRDIELVANGSDPTGLIREPSKNRRLALPGTTRGQPDINEAEGPFAAELPRLWVEHTTPATDP